MVWALFAKTLAAIGAVLFSPPLPASKQGPPPASHPRANFILPSLMEEEADSDSDPDSGPDSDLDPDLDPDSVVRERKNDPERSDDCGSALSVSMAISYGRLSRANYRFGEKGGDRYSCSALGAELRREDASADEGCKARGRLPPRRSELVLLEGEGKEAKFHMEKAILRYAGRASRTHPSCPSAAVWIDEWVEKHTEFALLSEAALRPERHGLPPSASFEGGGDAWVRDTHLPAYFADLEREVEKNEWIGGMDGVSIADFCWSAATLWADERYASFRSDFPACVMHLRRVEAEVRALSGAEEEGEEDSAGEKAGGGRAEDEEEEGGEAGDEGQATEDEQPGDTLAADGQGDVAAGLTGEDGALLSDASPRSSTEESAPPPPPPSPASDPVCGAGVVVEGIPPNIVLFSLLSQAAAEQAHPSPTAAAPDDVDADGCPRVEELAGA